MLRLFGLTVVFLFVLLFLSVEFTVAFLFVLLFLSFEFTFAFLVVVVLRFVEVFLLDSLTVALRFVLLFLAPDSGRYTVTALLLTLVLLPEVRLLLLSSL